MHKVKIIFVDSDAFIALAKVDDSNHIIATKILDQIIKKPVRFLTSNYVFSEVVTVLSQRVNHRAAIQFIRTLQSPSSHFTIRWVDELIQESAIEIFLRQSSKNVSFVDCVNMAIIEYDKINSIFSFDQGYRTNDIPMITD